MFFTNENIQINSTSIITEAITKKEIIEDNIRLKQEVRRLRTQMDALKESVVMDSGSSNADLLRRISNLEKVIYGKE